MKWKLKFKNEIRKEIWKTNWKFRVEDILKQAILKVSTFSRVVGSIGVTDISGGLRDCFPVAEARPQRGRHHKRGR